MTEGKINKDRPYTLTLYGFLGQNKFYADLEGVNLVLKSTHCLKPKQIRKLEDELIKLFEGMYIEPFKQKGVDQVLSETVEIII